MKEKADNTWEAAKDKLDDLDDKIDESKNRSDDDASGKTPASAKPASAGMRSRG